MASRPRLERLRVKNYRSIGSDWVDIAFPRESPLVLIGENNAGKSNILRALNLILGEFWPGSHRPEDHEFFGRSAEGIEIKIQAELSGIGCPKRCRNSNVERLIWTFERGNDPEVAFQFEADNCDHTWVNNDLRALLSCMSVSINRDLSYQLSYGSKWTTLSKLMRRFHERLVGDEKRVTTLKDLFDRAVATFYEVREFREFADALKDATADFGGNLPYGLEIDFSAYDASNYFRSLRILPQLDGHSRTYEELGTGQEQVLAMAFAFAYAQAFGGEGLILAVEEPEAHLHPLAQQWVASRFRALAQKGVQVILTTHSPYFVDLLRPASIAVARKTDEASATAIVQLDDEALVKKVVELGASPISTTPTSVGPFYENASTDEIKNGLFSRGCLLVEGPSEQYGLPALLEHSGLDVIREGIAVMPVGGITNLAKWIRFFRAYEIPVYAILDSDGGKIGDAAENARASRREVFASLDVGCDDWTDLTSGPIGVTEKFAVLDPDYEGAMRAVFGQAYEELEREGRENLGSSKPLIARFAARALADNRGNAESWGAIADLSASLSKALGTERR